MRVVFCILQEWKPVMSNGHADQPQKIGKFVMEKQAALENICKSVHFHFENDEERIELL